MGFFLRDAGVSVWACEFQAGAIEPTERKAPGGRSNYNSSKGTRTNPIAALPREIALAALPRLPLWFAARPALYLPPLVGADQSRCRSGRAIMGKKDSRYDLDWPAGTRIGSDGMLERRWMLSQSLSRSEPLRGDLARSGGRSSGRSTTDTAASDVWTAIDSTAAECPATSPPRQFLARAAQPATSATGRSRDDSTAATAGRPIRSVCRQ